MPSEQATSFRPDRATILKKRFLFLFETMHSEDYESCVASVKQTFFYEYYYKQVSLFSILNIWETGEAFLFPKVLAVGFLSQSTVPSLPLGSQFCEKGQQ